jgi:hypothetical protein
LQQVFTKTGTHRQAELVRHLAETPTGFILDQLDPIDREAMAKPTSQIVLPYLIRTDDAAPAHTP